MTSLMTIGCFLYVHQDPVPTDSNGDIDMDPELAMARTMIQEGHQAGQGMFIYVS